MSGYCKSGHPWSLALSTATARPVRRHCTAAAIPTSLRTSPAASRQRAGSGPTWQSTAPTPLRPSPTEDVAAAVTFARDHGLSLVIKGTGHDYLGRSSYPDSLLIWTHHVRDIAVHEAFVPAGSSDVPGVPAITVGAGTRWLEAYQALAPHGRYVQGGGCTTVGAAGGFTQGGDSKLSRHFGTAAGNVLELEVVVASGEILVANARHHPDLFWALRGGGGGTFGVVTKMTMRTHPMPTTLGAVAGTVRARGDEDFRLVIDELVHLFPRLCDDHWGEQIRLNEDNSVVFSMVAVNLSDSEANAVWEPFLTWVDRYPDSFTSDVFVVTVAFDRFWDPELWDELAPEMICHDLRPGQPTDRFWWVTNQSEASQYLNAYHSAGFHDSCSMNHPRS